ncbi:Vgb family protein [Subtercola endophyticus]|uniref:Vgb family protein n=1 Tax=Subtercola endophyticus TaxID=2895559 RepID=UPI001E512AD3|nr:putative Ig domain-containing protein [Subtercola endophyticus]UFS57772.1 putative Ig domain-containing protein [Subtercola endophyticus]
MKLVVAGLVAVLLVLGAGALGATAAPVVNDWFGALPAAARPSAILSAPDGSIFTADSGTDSVSKILPDGTIDGLFDGTLPPGSLPQGLAQDARGALYVTSTTLSTVYKLDSATGLVDAAFAANLGTALDGRHPVAVTVSSIGDIFVATATDDSVSRLSPTGALIDTYPLAHGAEPVALHFADDGQLYTANDGDGTVSRITFDLAGRGTVVASWAELPAGFYPIDLAFDHHGFLYVLSPSRETVSKVDLALPPGANVVENRAHPSEHPAAITSDALGNIYTSDLGTNAVSMLSADGMVVGEVASLSGTPFGESITASDSGAVYIANSDTSSIARVDMSPRIDSFPPELVAAVGQPFDMTFSASGVDPEVFHATGGRPPGITMTASGELSGIPASSGTYEFDLVVTNAAGQSSAQHVVMVVAPRPGSTGCWFSTEACGL